MELSLPLKLRLQPVDPETPGTVALMRGPLVLFPLGHGDRTVQASDLLQARQTSREEWLVPSAQGDIRFRPFASIHDEPYSTYIDLAEALLMLGSGRRFPRPFCQAVLIEAYLLIMVLRLGPLQAFE